jgi:hypothetical protein
VSDIIPGCRKRTNFNDAVYTWCNYYFLSQQERTGIVTTTQPAIVILPPLAYPASYDQPPPPYDQGHE